MAVRVAGELAPCGRVGEWGSDKRNAGTDPTCPASGLPPGPSCRCGGQGDPAEGLRADRGRAVHQSTGSAWGEPVVGRVQKHQHGPGGLGLPQGGTPGHPGRVCSGPCGLPRCFGAGGGHSGSRNHSPTGWKRGKVVKEGPRDTLSQKVLRLASQQGASVRGGGSAGKHHPPAFPSRDWIRWPRSRRRRQWEAGGLSAVSRGPWAGNRRKLLLSLRGRKARPPGFPLALSPV